LFMANAATVGRKRDGDKYPKDLGLQLGSYPGCLCSVDIKTPRFKLF
jgi:hypothetical protein